MLVKTKRASSSSMLTRSPQSVMEGENEQEERYWTSESDLSIKSRRRSALIRCVDRQNSESSMQQPDYKQRRTQPFQNISFQESRKSLHAEKSHRYNTAIRTLRRRTTLKARISDTEAEDPTSACPVEADEATEQNALHLACKLYPTVETIERLVTKTPELVSQRNSLGQTPLHIAAAEGSSPRVIEYLLKLDGDSARVQDENGRTPLHLACSYKKLFDSGHGHTPASRELRKGPSHAVIKILCEAAPDTVNLEDHCQTCALEYAICSLTKPKVLCLLHSISEREWRGSSTKGRVGLKKCSLFDLSKSSTKSWRQSVHRRNAPNFPLSISAERYSGGK